MCSILLATFTARKDFVLYSAMCSLLVFWLNRMLPSLWLSDAYVLAAAHPTKLRIIGIANTHTLTSTSSIIPLALDAESTTPASPSKSKPKTLKIKTIHFSPYEPKELLAILKKRFENLPQDELSKLLPPPALELLTKKVAAITGDVRVLFEVLRGAIDDASSCSPITDASGAPPSPPLEVMSDVKVTPKHILSALKSYTPSSSSSSDPLMTHSSRKELTILDEPHVEFDLYGNQFRFRAAERAGRKFKHKETIEI